MSAQIHEFDPLIYPRRLWVAVGVPYEAIKDMFEDVEPMPQTANAQVDYTRRLKPDIKGGVLVQFPNRKTMTTEIIAHEAAHIAIGIFDYIEASIDIRNQEPFAYLCGWIAKCMEEVKRQKTQNQKQAMTLNEYQAAALETAVYPTAIIYPALGMCGESGEVADKVKKVIRDNNSEFTEEKKREIAKEIGDVMWYCATLANDLGYTLERIGEMNIIKLRSRKERGVIAGSGDNR